MKIGIEGQRLFRPKKHGMDRVAIELIKNLQLIDQQNEYFIFVRKDIDRSAIKETKNFRIIELEGNSFPYWEQYVLPKAAIKYGCQLLHCTSNTAPLFSSIPLITTIHDIIYLESSNLNILNTRASLYQRFGNLYRKLIVPRIAKKSCKIITVSHYEKNIISKYFGLIGDQRIRTVSNGVSDLFKPIVDQKLLEEVKLKYNLPNQFFFFHGNLDPRKNTKGTLKAFSDFIKKTNLDYKLVMLNYDVNELKKQLNEIGDPNLIHKIVLTGYVSDKELSVIYNLSKIFLFPSIREGFGIPILEAMACGVPVITSNTSSMPEVAGNAACIVNPLNSDEITNALIKILENKKYADDLIRKGKQRANLFSWNKMAEKVHFIYKEVYSEIKNSKS